MHLDLAAITAAVDGVLSPPTAAATVATGIDIDSRRLRTGDVFVALPGTKTDGHQFLPAAQYSGAAAALVRQAQSLALPQIVVADPVKALTALAAVWRACFAAVTVAAVTGSNGKTTVKEMLAAICRAAVGDAGVCYSRGSFNNHLGVPLTLLSLDDAHRYLIAEAGMNHAGELTALAALIQPQVAVITNAQRAHLGKFKSVTEIAEAKGELLSGLPPNGVAVLNADDPHYPLWCDLAAGRRVLTFGFSDEADIRAMATEDGILLDDVPVRLHVAGAHNRQNALAAAAAAAAMKLPAAAVRAGLESFRGVGGRLKFYALAGGGVLIDDSYNANPDSTAAALPVLVASAVKEHATPLLVMGDMLDLGGAAVSAHTALVAACQQEGIEIFGIGDQMGVALTGVGGRHFADKQSLINALRERLAEKKHCLLVKGSRGMKMEEITAAFAGEEAAV